MGCDNARTMSNPASGLAFLPLAFLATAAFGAPEEPIEIATYQAPEGCPGPQYIKHRVMKLIDWESGSTYDNVTANIKITRKNATGWRLVLKTTQAGNHSTRRLNAESCEPLSKSAALVIALMLDPELAVEDLDSDTSSTDGSWEAQSEEPIHQTPEEPVHQTLEPLPTEEKDMNASESTQSAGPKSPGSLALFAGPALDLGTIASASFATLIGGGVRMSDFGIDGSVVFLAPRKSRVSDSIAPGGKLWLIGGGLTGSWAHWYRSAALGAFLQVEMGAVNGRGVGVDISHEVWHLSVAFGGGLNTYLALNENWRLRGLFGVLLPAKRKRYIIEYVGTIHTVPQVLGRFAIILEWNP